MPGPWTVLASRDNAEANRCIDILVHGDGAFGFEEYRRDPEDAGGWTLVAYPAYRVCATRDEAQNRRRGTLTPPTPPLMVRAVLALPATGAGWSLVTRK
jgi:hypothetical protein